MGMGAVLEQVNSLPDSQARFIFLHWYGQLGLGERGPDMCRHVVRAFRLVLEKRIAIGNQPVKKLVQIFQNIRVSVFLNQQRCRGMGDK